MVEPSWLMTIVSRVLKPFDLVAPGNVGLPPANFTACCVEVE